MLRKFRRVHGELEQGLVADRVPKSNCANRGEQHDLHLNACGQCRMSSGVCDGRGLTGLTVGGGGGLGQTSPAAAFGGRSGGYETRERHFKTSLVSSGGQL